MAKLTPEKIQAFVDNLERQIQIYQSLGQVTQKQIEYMKAGDHEAMMALLGEKQRLMDDLEPIEAKIRPIKELWEPIKSSVPPASIQPAEDALRRVRDSLKQLIDLENAWKELVDKEKSAVREKLSKLTQARQMKQAYGPPTNPDPRFWDQKE